MLSLKPELKSNPKGVLEPYITTLQSESKMARKQAFQKINYEIFENPLSEGCDFTIIFPEIYAYVLKGFSDPSEGCREMSIVIISNFIEHLPLNDYYLTYILPVIVRRIGCAEIVEESEEVRLLLIELVHKILIKYKNTQLLTSFFNDFTSILTKTSTDPFPKVKLETCECIILLSKIIDREFHLQCESFIKPVLSNFAHQHFRVRVAAIRAIGAIVISGNAKCFELSITPMAEKLFDENTQVRMQVTLEVGNWMMKYKDRYSFWHRMIPLMLTSLSDVMADIRTTAIKLWSEIGLQYLEENEEDLKKKLDFLKDVPTHYPDVKRPNFGCRCLVQTNIGKIVPAIGKEMDGWQSDARLRVAQLLCWLVLCAEEGATQHANAIVKILMRGAADEDARVVLEIKRAAELFGYFIMPETWWPLLEADVDGWPALTVITNILKGSKPELVKGKVMKELCKELADPDRCRVRKPKYQSNLVHVTEALMSLCGQDCAPVYEDLFIINFTVYAMPYDDKMQFLALSNLDKLRQLEDCGRTLTTLYDKHIRRILVDITSDALTWTLLTPDRCLLECVLLNAGYAMGSQLHLLAPLLRECLATPQVDPEVKLKVFTALSTVLLRRQTNFSKCDTDKLESFLKIVIEEIIVPNLVWAPGRTAEAIRTAAAACLCSALQDDPQTCLDDKGADGDANDKKVNLFPSKECLEPLLERVVPLVCAAADDNSALTRQHALRAAACLATLAATRGCFTSELLHKMYFVVLKRLDDSSDKVRSFAVRTVRTLFSQRPRPYDTVVFGAHVDALYSAMLIHLDDPDEEFRKEMLAALIALSDVDPHLLIKKVKANIHLYRNKAAYESLSSNIENMLK
ncbi:PREDICTED: dynein assembly factor 5, axonemal [Papilio xuthus]|uniref:Dynein assembly factor 5, axonemal n=1 Tax=Papilio xuthus TaxID=66420 RepID=A0AAJ6ZCA1_PAPXU|nr:PREDICTED: dynein assembly factor 5, axonemal [Papilio xuthus]